MTRQAGTARRVRRPLLALAPPARRQRPDDVVALESLADQVSTQAVELGVILDRRPAPQAPCQRGFDERIAVELAEDLVDGLAGDAARDAGALDLTFHTQPAVASCRGFPPRDGLRR